MESIVDAYPLVWDIEELQEFQEVHFVHVSRSFNGIPHSLAHVGLNSNPIIWGMINDYPPWLLGQVHGEKSLFVSLREISYS